MEHKLLLSSTLSLQKHWPYSQLRHLAFCEFWLSNSSPQTCVVGAYLANNLFKELNLSYTKRRNVGVFTGDFPIRNKNKEK